MRAAPEPAEGVAENAEGGWSRLRHSLRRDSLKTVHWTVFACFAGRSLRGRPSPAIYKIRGGTTMPTDNKSEIVIFKTADEKISVDVRFEGETVWLTQAQLVDLYGSSKANVSEHIKHIFEEEELTKEATVRKFRTVQTEGSRNVEREVEYYNLDMIISLGYRIKSKVATQFRQWATKRLNEYIRKGFTMDDERLKEAGGGDYWKELLSRIRDIRSSEKVMYRQVLDLYATSADYNPKSAESVAFFKMVQNKLHYAVNRQTAAEIIYDRADSEKDFMGLTSFKGADVTLEDVRIAKNYLSEKELKKLNALVSAFFDMAEYQAENHNVMHMSDYVEQLDRTIKSVGEEVLEGAGKISHKKAMEKAEGEYRKYQVKTLSSAEKAYIETLKELKRIEGKKK